MNWKSCFAFQSYKKISIIVSKCSFFLHKLAKNIYWNTSWALQLVIYVIAMCALTKQGGPSGPPCIILLAVVIITRSASPHITQTDAFASFNITICILMYDSDRDNLLWCYWQSCLKRIFEFCALFPMYKQVIFEKCIHNVIV